MTDYSSLNQISISSDQSDLLELGKRLVAELGKEDSTDTLGRWQSHYLAELISAAEGAIGENAQTMRDKCFEKILALWSHSSSFPSGRRPFEDIEPIARALESLDPDSHVPRYFRFAKENREVSEDSDLVELIQGIDAAARILIGDLIAQLYEQTDGAAREWVQMEPNTASWPLMVFRAVDKYGMPQPETKEQRAIETLTARINELNRFIDSAEGYVNSAEAVLEVLRHGQCEEEG